jgi:hypothetical protein
VSCDAFKDRVGYRGQKYEVRFTNEDGLECIFGWQNEPAGGLADAAALHPGWSNVRVVPVEDGKAFAEAPKQKRASWEEPW